MLLASPVYSSKRCVLCLASFPNTFSIFLRFLVSIAIRRSYFDASSFVIWRALLPSHDIPCSFNFSRAGGYMGLPTPFHISSVLVAAESTIYSFSSPASAIIFLNMNSAIGERHILPWQMNRILVIIISLCVVQKYLVLIILCNDVFIHIKMTPANDMYPLYWTPSKEGNIIEFIKILICI